MRHGSRVRGIGYGMRKLVAVAWYVADRLAAVVSIVGGLAMAVGLALGFVCSYAARRNVSKGTDCFSPRSP